MMAAAVALCVGATVSSQRSAWVGLAVGAGFALTGVLFAASRHAFEIDWRRRVWREVDGLLRVTRERRGSLDDFAAVVVSRHRRPGLTWPRRFSVIALARRDEPVVVDLFLVADHDVAKARAVALANRMRLPFFDAGDAAGSDLPGVRVE